MERSVDDLIAPKPEARQRLYVWSYVDPSPVHEGLVKVGQTARDVNARIRESQGVGIQPHILHTDPDTFAERDDGSVFRDTDVHRRLREKGFENPNIEGSREWFRCTPEDAIAAIKELQSGLRFTASRDLDFPMRTEQREAVEQTLRYYQSRWDEDPDSVPRFLWNAKMRFGKTFTSYQLAKALDAKRVLIVTFKPAVEEAWREDLERHIDFDGWEFQSSKTDGNPLDVEDNDPLVYFGSFQDLLGTEGRGNAKRIKAKNEWIHLVDWDLVIFDEYHFGAWRHASNSVFDEEKNVERIETEAALDPDSNKALDLAADSEEVLDKETDFLPISSSAFLYLSGTPFRALSNGEFIEEQIFNWTYTDEQRAKGAWADNHPGKPNPYAALPKLSLLTYQMPDALLSIASGGEFDEFDLNAFFATEGKGKEARFTHKDSVQKWLDIIRGEGDGQFLEALKARSRPPWPYSDVRLRPYLNHSFWYLPNVAACYAMKALLEAPHNVFWHDYDALVVAGTRAGIGLNALAPVQKAIGSGFDTKTITLSCGKLTTGVTVKPWSSILMLRNLKSPESYFQAAFRVQSPWSIRNPEGDDPTRELVLKPECFVFDFAPTRALRQVSDYGLKLSPNEDNPEAAVADLVAFLPVLAFDGAKMVRVDAGGILDIAMTGTSATLLARKWESAHLVNVDDMTLRRVMGNADAMDAVSRIEGWRALGENPLETIVNKSERIKDLKKKAKDDSLSPKEKKELTQEEREFKSMRKEVQKKLIKFATRIPAFMYLTDARENTLQDVIRTIDPTLFRIVTGLTVADFDLLVELKVFQTEKMNEAVFGFRRYENASLAYTGLNRREGQKLLGGYDVVVTSD